MIEILESIGFDWQVALAQLVNFLLILAVIHWLFYKPVRKVIAERQAKIAAGLSNAQEAEEALGLAESQSASALAEARREAQDLMVQARARADELEARTLGSASTEAQGILKTAQEKAGTELSRMRGEFSQEASALVVASIDQLLGETLTAEQRQGLNGKALASLQELIKAKA